jgi:hypothetical protein
MESKYFRVTPKCCEESNKYRVPYLEFIRSKDESFLKDMNPVWCVKALDSFYDRYFEVNIEVKYCPYCGISLPEIELNPLSLSKDKEIYNTDSGDYCESCGERSMCCECLPASFRWRPVGKELVLPDNKKEEI